MVKDIDRSLSVPDLYSLASVPRILSVQDTSATGGEMYLVFSSWENLTIRGNINCALLRRRTGVSGATKTKESNHEECN